MPTAPHPEVCGICDFEQNIVPLRRYEIQSDYWQSSEVQQHVIVVAPASFEPDLQSLAGGG